MSQTWARDSAADLGRGIAAGRIDPVELAEFFLERIAAHPDEARIFARMTPDRARTEAMAAAGRARAGGLRGPLDGVPMSWKDLFDTAGTVTEAGSRLLAGRVPGADATVVAAATRAGTVCLGKTHMSELAFAGLGYNPMTATPPNALFPGAVPGGSSSGAGVSVALGLSPVGIGSDTGGSVRVPAAWNDLVGLKTSYGVLSLDGVVPLCSGFDTVGPLARTVEDAALAFAAMGGPVADLAAPLAPSDLTLAVLETLVSDDMAEVPARAYEAALARLSAAGVRVTRIKVPAAAEAMKLAGMLYTSEAYATWEDTIEAAPDKMFDRVRERFRQGGANRAVDYIRARARLGQVRQDWAQAVAGHDAVLMPTSPILPPAIDRIASDPEAYVADNLLALRNTRVGNLLDQCGLTLPTQDPGCGLTVLGPAGGDARLLQLGAALAPLLR